jgi:hypothetical protein
MASSRGYQTGLAFGDRGFRWGRLSCDPDGALFVHPESVETMRSAALTLLGYADLRALLIAKGFQNVEKYRPEAVAAQYAVICRSS